jgi:FKBP-type peptidyl-prolyl cis-trans isomerase (trigger factor)
VAKRLVEDREVDEAIRQASFFYADWKEVKDRAVQEGGFIMIDLDVEENGEKKRVFNRVRFEVRPEKMAVWMRNLVLNAKAGDILEGMSEPDADSGDVMPPKKVFVHLLHVEEAVLPAIDDVFAKKLGAPSAAALPGLVREVLQKQLDDKAQDDLRESVNEFLVANYVFDLPASLLDAEVEHRVSQQPNVAKEKLEEEALQSLRLFYLSKQIVADHKIPISHQEVNQQAIKHRPKGSGTEIAKEEYALALSMVFLRKAQDFILEKND